MIFRSTVLRRWRHHALLALGAVLTLSLSVLTGLPGAAQAADPLPCDIYAAGGTPCVAAHSTTRALYGAYSGPLYQVQRASDGASRDIGLLVTGGYADAGAQDTFCAGTSCIITIVYDQSPHHNNLTVQGPGDQHGQDVGANATRLPITAGGHKVYGIWVDPGVGYRHNLADGTARGSQPEGMYMVASGTHANSGCCFDYGNAEATGTDTGNGHMDAVTLATTCFFPPCAGAGPWVQGDLENGLFQGANGSNLANTGNASAFVTAVLKNNGTTTYAIKGGNAQTGALTTWWNGALPNRGGYQPMSLEGSIILGTGGDNSAGGIGSFFEGVMTAGYPTDATEDAVQANIVSVGYSGVTGLPADAGTITGPGGQCVDVNGDDTGGDGAPVQLWGCQGQAVDQHWTHSADGSLTTLGRCLDATGNGTANGTLLELWDCTGGGAQQWIQRADGSLFNPQSGRCADSPNGATASGTRLQLWDCNGSAAQKFSVNGGAPVVGPGGKCVDVIGDDIGANGAPVNLWDCQTGAADQHWFHQADGALSTINNRCLDVTGNGTAAGTQVQLWDCNGGGAQDWVQQADGSLLNPQSGRCLDSPNGATDNGTRLQIWDCNGSAAQKFALI